VNSFDDVSLGHSNLYVFDLLIENEGKSL
jgi:hypothetical protein